jgi:hypothetical protein
MVDNCFSELLLGMGDMIPAAAACDIEEVLAKLFNRWSVKSLCCAASDRGLLLLLVAAARDAPKFNWLLSRWCCLSGSTMMPAAAAYAIDGDVVKLLLGLTPRSSSKLALLPQPVNVFKFAAWDRGLSVTTPAAAASSMEGVWAMLPERDESGPACGCCVLDLPASPSAASSDSECRSPSCNTALQQRTD